MKSIATKILTDLFFLMIIIAGIAIEVPAAGPIGQNESAHIASIDIGIGDIIAKEDIGRISKSNIDASIIDQSKAALIDGVYIDGIAAIDSSGIGIAKA